MVRQCICERYPARSLEIRLPQLYCPVCVLWETIRRRERTGGKLSPGASGPGFTDRLRSLARRLGWERAERLGPLSIRRGAARAILEAGGSFAQLLKAGHWHSSALRYYLDLGVEETAATAAATIESSDDVEANRGMREEREDEGINPGPLTFGSDIHYRLEWIGSLSSFV